jgi:hypothetical protein
MLVPESCTTYRSEALQNKGVTLCKIQVVTANWIESVVDFRFNADLQSITH